MIQTSDSGINDLLKNALGDMIRNTFTNFQINRELNIV